jgi:O-methyltransferase involved in polyketide biosynthesis
MEHDRPSRTAEHVAALRGLGVLLPPAARLIDDPFGAEWTGWGWLRRLGTAMPGTAQAVSRPVWHWLLYMQVRTYALDQEVIRFAQAGGRQLAVLGAGLDARALRLRHLGLRVFEIDHPATQARTRDRKRGAVSGTAGVPPASGALEEQAGRLSQSGDGGGATFVAWDFEHEPLGELPQRLSELGWQRGEPGCVVWEGVTMYLSEAANAATFSMLADLLAPGSVVAFTYFASSLLTAPGWRQHLMRQFVAHHREPWLFGWEPNRLPAWLAARGFALEHDDSTMALAARFLLPDLAAVLTEDQRRIALARRVEPANVSDSQPGRSRA